MEIAYKKFFKGLCDKPKFKSKNHSKQSFYVDTDKIKITGNKVKLEKLTLSKKKNKQKFNWIKLAEKNRIPTLDYIKTKYEFPLACYKKYNGYLGIISHKNNELIFFSKTTNEGEKAERFKEIFYKYTTENFRKRLLSILIENDCSLTCEVIDIKNDPHIIDSNVDEAIYLLDLIKNELTYNNLQEVFTKEIFLGLLFDEREIYDIKHIQAKEIKEWILSPSELEEWIKKSLQENDTEGYVIQSKNNKQLFKLKTNYYNEWKSCRYLTTRINNSNGYFEMRLSQSPLQVKFGKWYSDNFKRLKGINNILILREKFEEEVKKC